MEYIANISNVKNNSFILDATFSLSVHSEFVNYNSSNYELNEQTNMSNYKLVKQMNVSNEWTHRMNKHVEQTNSSKYNLSNYELIEF